MTLHVVYTSLIDPPPKVFLRSAAPAVKLGGTGYLHHLPLHASLCLPGTITIPGRTPLHTFSDGRHELGQNFLTDTRTIAHIIDIVGRTQGPIVEIGAGRGALTRPLQNLNRPITAVEIHPGLAGELAPKLPSPHKVITADFLRYPLPRSPHVVVGNLPFHLTTAVLRKLLHHQHWNEAVLLTQWEVARRRAGVGGSSMMTAQWAPFYEFTLEGRVPARAFTPAPSVDGGLFTITRRSNPLLAWDDRSRYARFIHSVFTSPGRGMVQILRRLTRFGSSELRQMCGRAGIPAYALPKDFTAEQWALLWSSLRSTRGNAKSAGAEGRKKHRRRD